jgi:hypothetical protein
MCNAQTHRKPRASPNQAVLEYDFKVIRQPGSISSHWDYFGNEVTMFSVTEPHREMIVTSCCTVELASLQLPDLNQSPT